MRVSHTRRALWTIQDYIKELWISTLILGVFAMFYAKDRKLWILQIKHMKRDPAQLYEALELLIPHLFHWYKMFNEWYSRMHSLKRLVDIYKKSPPFWGNTPAEALRIHELQAEWYKWESPPAKGKIRIQFFTSLAKGRYRSSGNSVVADARMDLVVDPLYGVNLRHVREELGLQSIAIITDITPYRIVFDPATQDSLSPLAAYDLSKQLRQPIRVFEPHASRLTVAKRRVRETWHRTSSTISALAGAIAGFPIKDAMYAKVLHGERFVATCTAITKTMRPLRLLLTQGGLLLIQLLCFLALVPCIAGYHTYLGAKAAACWALDATVKILVSAVTLLLSISKRGWIVLLGLCWFGAAEYYAAQV